jgi:hypothetical protein
MEAWRPVGNDAGAKSRTTKAYLRILYWTLASGSRHRARHSCCPEPASTDTVQGVYRYTRGFLCLCLCLLFPVLLYGSPFSGGMQASMSQRLLQYWRLRIKHRNKCPDMPAHAVHQGVCACVGRESGGEGLLSRGARAPESVRLHRMGARLIVSAARPLADQHSAADAAMEKSSGRRVAHARCGLPPDDTAPSNQPPGIRPLLRCRWRLIDGATVRRQHSTCGGYPVAQSAAWRSAEIPTVHAATHTPWNPPKGPLVPVRSPRPATTQH